jgi:hypothetical protein
LTKLDYNFDPSKSIVLSYLSRNNLQFSIFQLFFFGLWSIRSIPKVKRIGKTKYAFGNLAFTDLVLNSDDNGKLEAAFRGGLRIALIVKLYIILTCSEIEISYDSASNI